MYLDAAHGLLAVKTLAKDPAGSEFLASSANLSTLLSLSSTFKDDAEASAEALRCIANTVLLIDHARSTFIEKSVNGGEICITLLEVSHANALQHSLLKRVYRKQILQNTSSLFHESCF